MGVMMIPSISNDTSQSKSVAGKDVKAAKPKEAVPVRLHVSGTVLGHRRSKRNTHFQTALLSLEGVQNKESAQFYCGKRVAYVYKGQVARKVSAAKPTKFRVVWGKIVKPHGTNGVVQAKFATNLPPQSYGKPVRVFLYPSNI